MSTVLVTGSAGLVGSAAVARFARRGMRVVGVDNDQRAQFFGPAASVRPNLERLRTEFPGYEHHELDIRSAQAIDALIAVTKPELIVHAAGQPSHDWSAGAPLVDFEVNATATLQLLESVRSHCPEAVFVFVSTNKVYGDGPNHLPLVDVGTRLELAPDHRYAARGFDESLAIDQTMHSLLGCSKLAADFMVQEYGRYFGLKTACFRCGCITGASHAAVPLHGFLAYVMRCAVTRTPYVIQGYDGKQVRDNIHADDLAAAFEAFWERPGHGAVYNMGGGRAGSCSVREAITLCEQVSGQSMQVSVDERARRGDHAFWITDVSRFARDYPEWKPQHELGSIVQGLYERRLPG